MLCSTALKRAPKLCRPFEKEATFFCVAAEDTVRRSILEVRVPCCRQDFSRVVSWVCDAAVLTGSQVGPEQCCELVEVAQQRPIPRNT